MKNRKFNEELVFEKNRFSYLVVNIPKRITLDI